MAKLEISVEAGNKVSDEILLKLSSVSGGWRVLVGVGAVAAAIGGLVVKIAPFIIGHA